MNLKKWLMTAIIQLPIIAVALSTMCVAKEPSGAHSTYPDGKERVITEFINLNDRGHGKQ